MVGAISLLEGTTKDRSSWIDVLGISEADIERLILSRILRPNIENNLILNFVGIIVFDKSLIFSRPKFDVNNMFDIEKIIRILRDYFSKSKLRRPFVDNTRDPEYDNTDILREYDALRHLQNWFNEHGIFRQEQSLVGNSGHIHWGKTITKCNPVLIQGSVIYPSVIREKRTSLLNEISALQINILLKLIRRYGVIDHGNAIEHAAQATGSIIENWPMTEDKRVYFERRLAIEQNSVYRTDTLQLFKLLRNLLTSCLAKTNIQPQIYGTTAFYAVWEDACRAVMGIDYQTTSAIPLGQPVWWTNDERGKVGYEHRQIPDITLVYRQWHVIADAKYYYPFPQSRPGWADIVKQIYYADSRQVDEHQLCSLFLLPLPGQQDITFLGYSTVECTSHKFSVIEAWGLDPMIVLLNYPKVSSNEKNSLLNKILGQRPRVAEFIRQIPAYISR